MRLTFIRLICILALVLSGQQSNAQNIDFTEFDLSNGLHVILHQDHSAPVVAVSVMYHVGSKNEVVGRTGFAHFFEHLLFEGSDNIKRGEFMKLVSANGGQNNANTTQDRTFYYDVFPANQFKLGLWLESERMMHPVINQVGVKTQNEVVKEEKRMRIDNQPYGHFVSDIFKKLFTQHPYNWPTIGTMQDLDAAQLDEFKAFFGKYYVPKNAVLSIAGDIDLEQAKVWINNYFGDIPGGEKVNYVKVEEPEIRHELVDTSYDANIQLPLIATAYRVPGLDTRDAKIMELISYYLSNGGSSKLYKKMIDIKRDAVNVGSFNYTLEDYGAYITYAIPNDNADLKTLLEDIDLEIGKLQTDLISDEDYQKIRNQYETHFISANEKMIGIAETLADGYTFHHHDTGDINHDLEVMRGITREEIRKAAKKYLQPNSRVVLYTLPGRKNS